VRRSRRGFDQRGGQYRLLYWRGTGIIGAVSNDETVGRAVCSIPLERTAESVITRSASDYAQYYHAASNNLIDSLLCR
jgi:hypothetical protein